MLSSHGDLTSSLSKNENSIRLTQLASRVDFAMHTETSDGDDPFAKVKKASEDLYLMTSMISLAQRSWPEVMNTLPLRARLQKETNITGGVPVQDKFRRVLVAADKRRFG